MAEGDVRRGECRDCGCREYQKSEGSKRCDRCGHGLSFHKVLGAEASAPQSGQKLTWQQKLQAAKQERNLSGASYYIIRNFAIWSVVTALGVLYCLAVPGPEFDRGFSDEFYMFNALAFFLAICYACISYFTSKSSEKKELSKILICINIVACISYIIQAYRLTPCFLDFVGHPVDVSRFFECHHGLFSSRGWIHRSDG
ncbi:hypothetical protein DFJ73DRAFT_478386 [Zopfochytrium polystomum]|nr:hypothetical protein DFJ73DRAFT_478386 [Zopfochytrium polystomum]